MEDAGESVPANSTNSTEQAASSEDTGESAPANSTNSTEITVSADTDETPYILLAFENTVTEAQIKNSLSVTKQNSSDKLEIHWVNYDTENSEDGQIDENKDINATTDIIHNKTDNKDYRVAILRLKDAGTYQVNTGSLSLDTQKSQGVSIAPFEELELTLNNQQVSGEIKYAEENTKYVLRTYFAKEKGGADYLIDEQEITNSSSISVNIPSMGALAPSGEYYVTSFLMTEKSVESIDENGEKETLTGLVAIDHQQFNTRVSYQNQNQPTAPQTVTLELAGNEIMTATWGAVTDADGYAVTIYQKDGNDWIDTGFGYDLDKETTSINMALTVGGEETTKSKNLSANETYKVGVSAYKTIEGGKYYSAETESAENGVYLPEYTPLDMMLFVNGTTCTADEHGVYRAYVDGKDDVLTVSCTTENVTYKVTRMDKTSDNEISTDSDGAYPIPNFEGNLMFKIDGISEIENSTAKDVTSVFLLVSVDKTAPMLTLSDPVFYADMTTGAYQITGTADAGSKIIYGDDGASVNAGSDGTFTIPGTLDENSGVLSLCAQDSAGNKSTSRFALITKQNTATEFIVTFDGNGGTPSVGSMTTTNQKLSSLPSASRSKHSFDGWYTEKSGGTKITTDTVFSANTTVYAHWTYTGGYNPPVTYCTLRFETGGGRDITSVRRTYNACIDLTKYVPTWRGYTFIGWYSDRSLTNKVSEVYLTRDLTVYAGWRVDENPSTGENPFTDVSEKDWFFDDVLFVYDYGLMVGTGKTLFSPHETVTRGMMATILWRMEGSPIPKGKNRFTDVEAGKRYADAITWTAENGIFADYDKDRFKPDDPITREQLAAIFYRYADYKGYDLTVKGNLDKFKDADKITDYAKTAMQWAVGSDLVKGKSGALLDPQDKATRAEIATMLHRFIEKYELVRGIAPGGLMGWIDPKRLQIIEK